MTDLNASHMPWVAQGRNTKVMTWSIFMCCKTKQSMRTFMNFYWLQNLFLIRISSNNSQNDLKNSHLEFRIQSIPLCTVTLVFKQTNNRKKIGTLSHINCTFSILIFTSSTKKKMLPNTWDKEDTFMENVDIHVVAES